MEHKILEILAGSISYGTNIATSDVDKRGIFTLPQKEIITKFGYYDEIAGKEPDDYRYYELSKFHDLLAKQNPNIMEILWTDAPHIVTLTPAGEALRSHRENLLSQEVSRTYVEYAVSQLKRIKGHSKMIMKPQNKEAPTIKEFVKVSYNFTHNLHYNKYLPEDGFVLYKHDNSMIAVFSLEKFRHVFPSMKPQTTLFLENGNLRLREQTEFSQLKQQGLMPDMLLHFNREGYDLKMDQWRHYWSWVKNRNPVRSDLEIKYGYDTKHAMHVMRLLRSGYEILTQGRVNVFRPDAKELLDIRSGAWSYEKLLENAAEMQDKISSVKSCLPVSIDRQFLSEVVFEVYEKAWQEMKLENKKLLKP